MIIAIDGPAASGKGTIARMLAAKHNFAHLDTGTLYRKTALLVLQSGGDPADPADAAAAARRVHDTPLSEEQVRSEAAGEAASKVAAIPEVRAILRDYQRAFAATPPGGKTGAVLDGRDIGTVICPEAEVKLFVTASAEVRAARRHRELLPENPDLAFETVLAQIHARDARDSERADSPMKPADDAHLLDTSGMTIEEAFNAACGYVRAAERPKGNP